MIFNYGYGRGLFIQKNKSFKLRQIVAPSLLVILILLLIFSFFSILSFYLLLIVIFTYSLMNLFFVYKLKLNILSSFLAFFCFVCIHFYWSIGLLLSYECLIQKKIEKLFFSNSCLIVFCNPFQWYIEDWNLF